MKFNSQICTSLEQSERLLSLGLKKETADMHWRLQPYYNDEGFDCGLEWSCNMGTFLQDDAYELFLDYMPAWSLHRLIEMMPKCITIDGDSAYPLQITKRYDGQWVVGYQGWYDAVGYLYDNIIFIYQLLISEGYIDEEFCNKG